MGVEQSGPDHRLRDVAEAMRGVIELLEVYWTGAPDASSSVTVSAPQLRVLYVLERREGINLRQLGAELGAASSSVSRLCDRLEAIGFVRRSSSTASRREVELRLTAQGRAHLDRLRARREERLAAVLAQVTPASRARLVEAVEAIRAALSAVRAEPEPSAPGHEERPAAPGRKHPPDGRGEHPPDGGAQRRRTG
ncbi:MarR family transcriptional regulator [Kitasatospora albolonga]|uniref:MarR family transcriptional regulator n=1 Tax=Kitasatospora albolonga TaxID=68173 RepID=A0ABC8BQD0_9ACTN|nr:MarR family transcriptional regulator [Kitasatospora albolonga]